MTQGIGNVVNPKTTRRDMQSGMMVTAGRTNHMIAGKTMWNPAYRQHVLQNMGKNWGPATGGSVNACCVRIGLAISEAFSFMAAHISALRLANPFGCIPRPLLPDWPRDAGPAAPPCSRPWPTGCTASRGIKGEGFARNPHPFPALRCASGCGFRSRP